MMKSFYQRHFLFLAFVSLMMVSTKITAQVAPIPIEKMDSCMLVNPKPIVILLTTDWCKYCQVQKAQLSKNKNFQKREVNFYYVEFNAESKDDIHFHGNNYSFQSAGVSSGIHELAIALNGGDENLSFPTWIILDSDYNVLFKNNGVLSEKQLNKVLNTLDEVIKIKPSLNIILMCILDQFSCICNICFT